MLFFCGTGKKEDIRAIKGGSRNKVFCYERLGKDYVLRISSRQDRTFEHINAELSFINFLADNGLSVCRPIHSVHDNWVEKIILDGHPFFITSFEKAPGKKLAEMSYRYRPDISLDEYFFNYGALLGRMHKLSKEYQSIHQDICRPVWLETRAKERISSLLADSFSRVKEKCFDLWDQLYELDIDRESYGLIHADLDDSNFHIDYSTGKITVYDFDDSCYCWFMYELAKAWRLGTGWIMHEQSVSKRQEFMEHYFEKVLEGYFTENNLSKEWLQKLDLFLKMVEMEKFLDEIEYMYEKFGMIVYNSYLLSLVNCIEQDIPRFGFFEKRIP